MELREIIEIEPRICRVINELDTKADPFSEYEMAKIKLEPLVGWWAHKEELQDTHPYNVVINAVMDKLRL